jgi:hypothetical protein
MQWNVSPTLDAEAGWRYQRRRYDDVIAEMEQAQPIGVDSSIWGYRFENAGESALFTHLFAAFNSYSLQLNKRLQLKTNLHWSYDEVSSKGIAQPRLRMTFLINERTTINAS